MSPSKFILKKCRPIVTVGEIMSKINLDKYNGLHPDELLERFHLMRQRLEKIAPEEFTESKVAVSDINVRDPKKWSFDSKKAKLYADMDLEMAPPIVLTDKGYQGYFYEHLLPGASPGKHTVIDGAHRLYAAIHQKADWIWALVPR